MTESIKLTFTLSIYDIYFRIKNSIHFTRTWLLLMTTHNQLSILFVCLGNICRSPLAEAILRHHLAEKCMTTQIRVDSAGTGAWHVGSGADPRSLSVAKANDITLDGSARQVTEEDFHTFDYIFAMDQQNFMDLTILQERYGSKANIKLFREFDIAEESALDVPDPYYGGLKGFQDLFQILDRTCWAIIDHLNEKVAS